jgi:hypothetical protein
MPNELTGDFDIVAEFSVSAANRLLAAMHRIERFPHAMALRVDDDTPSGPKVDRFTVVPTVDSFVDAPADHTKITGIGPISALFDTIVNTDVVGPNVGPLVPSRLRGRAQLELSPPACALGPLTSRVMMLESGRRRGGEWVSSSWRYVSFAKASSVSLRENARRVSVRILPSAAVEYSSEVAVTSSGASMVATRS